MTLSGPVGAADRPLRRWAPAHCPARCSRCACRHPSSLLAPAFLPPVVLRSTAHTADRLDGARACSDHCKRRALWQRLAAPQGGCPVALTRRLWAPGRNRHMPGDRRTLQGGAWPRPPLPPAAAAAARPPWTRLQVGTGTTGATITCYAGLGRFHICHRCGLLVCCCPAGTAAACVLTPQSRRPAAALRRAHGVQGQSV